MLFTKTGFFIRNILSWPYHLTSLLIHCAFVVASYYLETFTIFAYIWKEKLSLSYKGGFQSPYLLFSSARRALCFFHIWCGWRLFSEQPLKSSEVSTYWEEQLWKPAEKKNHSHNLPADYTAQTSITRWSFLILAISYKQRHFSKGVWYQFKLCFPLLSVLYLQYLSSKSACCDLKTSRSPSIWHTLSKKKRTTSVFLVLYLIV